MRFSYDILFEFVNQSWHVTAAQKPALDTTFTCVRLMDAQDGPFDADTLYVTDADTLLALGSGAALPDMMCICTSCREDTAPLTKALSACTFWIAASAPSLAGLLNQLLDHFFTLQMWEEGMSLLISHNGSMQELLNSSEPILGVPVLVCGPLFDSYQYTEHLASNNPFFVEVVENGYLSPESVAKLEHAGVFGTPAEDRVVKVFPPSPDLAEWHMSRHFRDHGERAFFVTAMCESNKPGAGTVELFDILAHRLYELFRKKNSDRDAGFGQQGLVLRDLLTSKKITRDHIEASFRKIGRKTEGVWCLALLRFQNPDVVSKTYQANLFRERYREALTCVLEGNIVVMAPSERLAGKAVCELEALAKRQRGCVGLSSKFTDIAEAQSALHQAEFAIRMGTHVSSEQVLKRQLGISKRYPKTCFRFDDYLLHELLDHYPLGMRGLNPGRRPAFALLEYDKANGTQKTRFLHTYLECNCSVSDTARILGIHRNSVGYQVKSIEALLGVDVHDIDFICHTRIAFASMEVFGL